VPLGRVDSYQCARLAFDVQEALNLHGACVFGHKLPAPRTAVQQSRPCGRQAPAREEDGDKQINDGKKKTGFIWHKSNSKDPDRNVWSIFVLSLGFRPRRGTLISLFVDNLAAGVFAGDGFFFQVFFLSLVFLSLSCFEARKQQTLKGGAGGGRAVRLGRAT